jgi:hypothetical protein
MPDWQQIGQAWRIQTFAGRIFASDLEPDGHIIIAEQALCQSGASKRNPRKRKAREALATPTQTLAAALAADHPAK